MNDKIIPYILLAIGIFKLPIIIYSLIVTYLSFEQWITLPLTFDVIIVMLASVCAILIDILICALAFMWGLELWSRNEAEKVINRK